MTIKTPIANASQSTCKPIIDQQIKRTVAFGVTANDRTYSNIHARNQSLVYFPPPPFVQATVNDEELTEPMPCVS